MVVLTSYSVELCSLGSLLSSLTQLQVGSIGTVVDSCVNNVSIRINGNGYNNSALLLDTVCGTGQFTEHVTSTQIPGSVASYTGCLTLSGIALS